MPVEIKFTADLSDVKAQLDRLIADARSHPISVGGSFGSGAGVGAFGGTTPTIAGTLGTANLSSINSTPSILQAFQLTNGFGGASATPGFFNAGFGAGGQSVAAGIFGFPASASSATGGAGPIGAGGSAGNAGIQQVIASRILTTGGFGGGGNLATIGNQGGWAGNTPTVTVLNQGGGTGGGGGGFGGGYGNYGMGGGGGSGGGGGNRFLGLSTAGLARYVGFGFLAREALRGGQLSRDYESETILAGNDQRELLKAEQKFQSGIGSFPIVGQAADLLADSIGPSKVGTEAILRGADAQEQRTELRRQFGRESERLRDQIVLSSLSGSFDQGLAEADITNRNNLRSIRERSARISDLDRSSRQATMANLESSRYKRVVAAGGRLPSWTPNWAVDFLGYDVDVAAQQQADAESMAARRTADDAAAATRVTVETEAENRRSAIEKANITRAFNQSNESLGFDFAAQARIGRGVPGSAETERLQAEESIRKGLAKIVEDPNVTFANKTQAYANANAAYGNIDYTFRSRQLDEGNRYRDSVSIARAEADAVKARLAARPLDASLAEHRARETAAFQNIDFNDDELWAATQERFATERRQIIKDYRFHRGQRLEASEARGRVLDIELKGGIYSSVAANAVDIKERAFLKLAEQQYEGERSKTIIQDLKNASTQEAILGRNFLLGFKPTEFDLQKTATSTLSGNGEVNETLKSIDDGIKSLNDKMRDIGKAQ